MPIYEYECGQCLTRHETYRRIEDRHLTMLCPSGHRTQMVYSVPVVSVWDNMRRFPNAVKTGDGRFPTRKAYESHLKANDIAEAKTDGKIKMAHGNKVISRF